MLQLPRVIRAALVIPIAIAAVALASTAPAYADRTIYPPVSGDVLAWQTNDASWVDGLHCMQVDKGRLDPPPSGKGIQLGRESDSTGVIRMSDERGRQKLFD